MYPACISEYQKMEKVDETLCIFPDAADSRAK